MAKYNTIISYSCIPILILWLVFIVVSILAPFFESHYMLNQSTFCYGLLRRFCAQVPTHCIWIFNSNMGLDCRCFFIYVLLFLTGLFFVLRKTKKIYWKCSIMLIIPVLLDGITQLLQYRNSTNTLRIVTGSLCGIGLGMFIYPIHFRIVSLFHTICLKKD